MSGNKKNVPKRCFKEFENAGAWEQHKVGDYYYFKNGLNKGKEFFGHGVPIVNFTDVFHNRGINASNLKGKVNLQPSEIENYRVQKGDIFFTRTSETIDEIGYPSVMLDEPKDTVFSGFVLRGRAVEEDPLTIKFKRYVFYTDEFRKEMVKKSSMTTRALTSGTAIKRMEFHFPKDKREQDKIGDYFQELDNLITLHQRKLEKIKALKKAYLMEMFPAEGERKPKLRFAGFTDDWEQRKFSDYYKICSGYAFKYQNYVEDGVAIVNGESIQHGKVESTKFNYLPASFKSEYANFILKEGDIVVGLNRPITDGQLKIARIPNYLDDSLLYQRAGKIKYINDVSDDFSFVLLEKEILKHTLKEAVGSDQPFISTSKLEKWKMLLPKSSDEQYKIGTYFKSLENLITLHHRKLEKLQNVKKAYLNEMFI